ncbi:MAG: glycosyltransferase family 4 protein [Cyanobacteria bacterium J06656_5]
MKISHFIYWDFVGGGASVLVSLMRELKRNHQQILFTSGRETATQGAVKLEIPIVQVPTSSFFRLFFGVWVLALQLIKHRPDVLVLQGQWSALFGAIAGKLAGISRMVYIVHWPAFYTDWDLIRIIRNYLAEKIPCLLVHKVIFLSESNRYHYVCRQLVHPKKTEVIANCIDPSNMPSVEDAERLRAEMNWSKEDVNLVCVSRITTQKRIDWLLHSWKIISELNLPAKLWIVGWGLLEDEIAAMIPSLGIDSSCTFLGRSSQGPLFIKAADIVVVPSMYEGHATVPLEAMACEKCVIACKVDGIRESIEHGIDGLLAPPGNHVAMAEAMKNVILNPQLRLQLALQGRKKVTKFNRSRTFGSYERIFEEIKHEMDN